jgi:hypothetical protein
MNQLVMNMAWRMQLARQRYLTREIKMNASFHVLLSSLLCISLATAGSGAQAESLERAEVRARLVAEGVDVTAAEARVAVLTDEEVALLAARFEELPAASGDPRGLVALVMVVAAVYVVVQFWPFFLIGGGALAAIKAGNRGST